VELWSKLRTRGPALFIFTMSFRCFKITRANSSLPWLLLERSLRPLESLAAACCNAACFLLIHADAIRNPPYFRGLYDKIDAA
jgi:hypothetical protein